MPGTAKNKGEGVDLPKQQTLLCAIRKSCIIEALPIRGREKAKWDLSQAFIVFLEGSVLISSHSKCLRTGIAWALGTASNNGKETGVLLQLALFSETGKMCYFFKWASTSATLWGTWRIKKICHNQKKKEIHLQWLTSPKISNNGLQINGDLWIRL